MITAAAAPTSAMPAAVDAAPNLVIAEERRSGTVKSDQPEPESGRKSDQFMFVDENDKNELQLSNQPTIRDWTDVVQKSKTVIDNSGYNKTDDESSNKSVKLTSSETPTFDFTKIETLFLNSTTTSSTDKRESEKPDIKDNTDVKIQQEEINVLKSLKIEDLVFGNIVVTEVNNKANKDNQQHRNKDAYSLNNTICGRKSSPSVDEKLAKCLNRNGQNKNKEKKPKTEERDIPSRGSSTASPLRSLTPSLDPELLRQFEEEDRPRRVLRSSTATASTPKAAVTDATFPNVTKVIKSGFTVKMAAKKSATRKSIPEKSRRKKSENPSTNFVGDKTFPLGTIFCSAPLNEGEKRKRSRSKDGSKEKQLHNKILRTDIDELLDDELVIALEDLRSTPMRPRRWSAASSSRASTSSASNGFTVITKMERRRGLSRARRSSFNSNWKLIGAPYESSVYIDYFFHEKQSTKQICYPQAVHSKTGDLLRLRDSVRVNSIDGEPNFACICRLFNDPKTGAPLASILWYYTPMQVKVDNTLIPPIFERELFASKHMDIIPLDTVDEIVWVLTYNEYGRFMAETRNDAYPLAQRVSEEDLLWKKGEDDYPRRTYLPRDDTPLEVVYFCRRIYDCKQQKVETKKTSEKNNQMKRLRRQSWKYRTKRHR